ncbi:MAG: TonB family protein [Bryobacterales bacterium]|nr:TonB family protein [Bryobacterales bacterium]
MSHPDLFDSREPLGKPFAGSLAMHAAMGGALLFVWFFHPSVETFGDKQQSSGSVGVSVVKTIPIPAKEGRVNPVANDTQSIVPQAPPKKKEVVKAPPPDPKAIKIPSRTAVKKPAPEQTSRYVYKPQELRPNQVYSDVPPAMRSPNIGMQGAGGVGLGQNTTLGTRFGAYVNIMRQRIAEKWNTSGMNNDGRRVLITFSILRDGRVQDVRVAQTSGNYSLDSSAQRAVLEANPLPPLPPGFEKDSAQVELWFQKQ